VLLEKLVIVGILVFREILGSKNLPLCDAFPHLFFISNQKEAFVGGSLVVEKWCGELVVILAEITFYVGSWINRRIA